MFYFLWAVIFLRKSSRKLSVLEAVQSSSLAVFIQYRQNLTYTARRLRERLNPEEL